MKIRNIKEQYFMMKWKTVKMNNDNKKLQSNMCILNRRILRKLWNNGYVQLKSLMVIYAHILKANKKEKGGKK